MGKLSGKPGPDPKSKVAWQGRVQNKDFEVLAIVFGFADGRQMKEFALQQARRAVH